MLRHVRVALQSLADNFGMINATVPTFLNIVDYAHRLVGPKPLEFLSKSMNKVSNRFVPTWNPYMPQVSQQCILQHILVSTPQSECECIRACTRHPRPVLGP